MKMLLWAIPVTALLLSSALAQAPAVNRSAMLDVAEENADKAASESWLAVYGSYRRKTESSQVLGITVRNMSPAAPGDFEIEWCFVAKPASGDKRFVYDRGSKDVSLKPSAFEKFVAESDEIESKKVHHALLKRTTHVGDRPAGWIVWAKVGEEIVRVKASEARLEQLAADKIAFDAFLKTMPSK